MNTQLWCLVRFAPDQAPELSSSLTRNGSISDPEKSSTGAMETCIAGLIAVGHSAMPRLKNEMSFPVNGVDGLGAGRLNRRDSQGMRCR
ncbi:hypothetical protein BELL_0191g00120 [Botrytis elliptica]|uniref:Uncharacterized protein n=1 Tax=Botrytis elliptica TaxID=278938 RepID=A0A4Z1JPU5_9HELO|nr:hypothetical protein BELL_0191g00120 [Botrytis elliptica]